LVKGLAALHGGEVRAASEGANRGSEFSILLPLIEAEPAEWLVEIQVETSAGTVGSPVTFESAIAAAAPAPALVEAGPLRVLVIEDNRDSAEMLQIILEMYGHQTELAHNGPKGIEAAMRMQPDAIVCDIGLPDMDGFEVAIELRGRGVNCPLIALSGYGQQEDKRMAREAGFDMHLTKPVEPDELAEMLQAVPCKTGRDV
jgi:CheY-like chemotaxis protein